MRRSRLVVTAAVVMAALWMAIGSSVAGATDSLAPPGAPPDWLPSIGWVRQRWLPYRESDLLRILDLPQNGLARYITNSKGLDTIVRKRGLQLQRVERELLAPWHGRVSAPEYRVLLEHTNETFTQHHLAVHMFFHNFHLWSVSNTLLALTHLSYPQIGQLRTAGLSLMDIAVRQGHTQGQVIAAMDRALRSAARQGVREHQVLPDQEAIWLGENLRGIGAFMRWKPSAVATDAAGQSLFSSAARTDVPSIHLFCQF